jgi:hypothetical protein
MLGDAPRGEDPRPNDQTWSARRLGSSLVDVRIDDKGGATCRLLRYRKDCCRHKATTNGRVSYSQE